MKMIAKKKLLMIIKITVSATLLYWLSAGFEWREMLPLFHRMAPLWLAAAILGIVASVAVSACKWQLVFRAMALPVPRNFLWRCYWAGLFCNNFLPSSIGGDGLRIYLSGRQVNDLPAGTASVIMERLLATLGLALTALLFYPSFSPRIPGLGLFFLLVALISGGLVCLIFSPALLHRVENLFQRSERISRFLRDFRGHGRRLAERRIVLLQALFWSVVFQLCVVLVNYCLFQALDLQQITFAQAAVLIPATSVAAMLPIGINGYGTREGAYVALFAGLGVSRAAAMTVSITFALLVTAASLYGGWLMLRGKILKGRWQIGETHFADGSPAFFSRP